MKKYWKLLLVAAGLGFFAACEDVPEPYNIPTEKGNTTPETPTGIEVTCAKAVELTAALADGATSAEVYSITGYITEIVGEVSKNQQTFWMADTQNGGRIFEAYWANLPEGVSEFKAGCKVKITGKLTKYVNNNTGKMTAEIKNATVEILEEGSGVTPTEGIEVTCAKAVELVNELADGATSAESYTITGYITEVVGSVSKNQQTFWMADTKDGGKVFEAYWANLPEGITEFKKGMKVKITGNLMKYVKGDNVTPEIKNANVVILEDGEDTPDPKPSEGATGTGTKDDPYNVAAAIANNSGTAWVKGYIVGWIDGKTLSSGARFDGNATAATNLIIADNADETDISKCMPVQLPTGAIRAALNLQDNPDNYKKPVLLNGSLEKYFGAAGLKSISDYVLDGAENPDPEPEPQPQPQGDELFSESFGQSQGAFTIEDKVLPDGVNYVWKFDSKYGMKASAYINKANYATESWLISPTIDLTGVTTATLTFDHAAKFFSNAAEELTVWVKAAGEEYQQVAVPNYPSGSDWAYISSGDIDLTAFAGKMIQVAFKYVSTASAAATWEIKNVVIK